MIEEKTHTQNLNYEHNVKEIDDTYRRDYLPDCEHQVTEKISGLSKEG